jgi:hypothetical protein
MGSVCVKMDPGRNHPPSGIIITGGVLCNRVEPHGSIPTVDEINALPEKFRLYIHDLETRCDKSGDVQTIALLREDRDALQRRVEELEAEVSRIRST